MEFKYKIGDKLKVIESMGSYAVGAILSVASLDSGCTHPVYRDSYGIGVYEHYLKPIVEDPFNQLKGGAKPMEKKLVQVLVINTKTGALIKDEKIVAVNEQSALLSAFGVKDSDNLKVTTSVLSTFEEAPKPVEVVNTNGK
jgi:hypothetical protein